MNKPLPLIVLAAMLCVALPLRAATLAPEQQAVHVVASDAHDTRRRVPILSAARNAVALWHGEERARTLVEDNPRAIVSGEKIRATSARAGR